MPSLCHGQILTYAIVLILVLNVTHYVNALQSTQSQTCSSDLDCGKLKCALDTQLCIPKQCKKDSQCTAADDSKYCLNSQCRPRGTQGTACIDTYALTCMPGLTCVGLKCTSGQQPLLVENSARPSDPSKPASRLTGSEGSLGSLDTSTTNEPLSTVGPSIATLVPGPPESVQTPQQTTTENEPTPISTRVGLLVGIGGSGVLIVSIILLSRTRQQSLQFSTKKKEIDSKSTISTRTVKKKLKRMSSFNNDQPPTSPKSATSETQIPDLSGPAVDSGAPAADSDGPGVDSGGEAASVTPVSTNFAYPAESIAYVDMEGFAIDPNTGHRYQPYAVQQQQMYGYYDPSLLYHHTSPQTYYGPQHGYGVHAPQPMYYDPNSQVVPIQYHHTGVQEQPFSQVPIPYHHTGVQEQPFSQVPIQYHHTGVQEQAISQVQYEQPPSQVSMQYHHTGIHEQPPSQVSMQYYDPDLEEHPTSQVSMQYHHTGIHEQPPSQVSMQYYDPDLEEHPTSQISIQYHNTDGVPDQPTSQVSTEHHNTGVKERPAEIPD